MTLLWPLCVIPLTSVNHKFIPNFKFLTYLSHPHTPIHRRHHIYIQLRSQHTTLYSAKPTKLQINMTSCNKCTMCTDDIIYAVDPIPESPRPLGRRLYVDSSVTRIQGPVEEHMPATPKSQKIRIPGWRKHCEALDRECDQRFASQDHEQVCSYIFTDLIRYD